MKKNDADGQPKITYEEVTNVLKEVKYKDYTFHLIELPHGFLLQVRYMEPYVETPGGPPVPQHCRKWFISPFSTETEVVRTVYKALLTSLEHQLGEHLTYKGERVYSPHLSIDARLTVCRESKFDSRIPPKKG